MLEAPTAYPRFKVGPKLWGFGAVQGGLTLALLTAAMRDRAAGRVLRRVSGEFKRPLRDELEIEVIDGSTGKSASWLSARTTASPTAAVSATALFSTPGRVDLSPLAPQKPAAPPPADCEVFTVPPEFVPFACRTEIRLVGTARPFGGGAEPELVAWLRLIDDDLPPDDLRLVVLMDCLDPSYGAILGAPVPIPTVTFTVSPSAGLQRRSLALSLPRSVFAPLASLLRLNIGTAMPRLRA